MCTGTVCCADDDDDDDLNVSGNFECLPSGSFIHSVLCLLTAQARFLFGKSDHF